MQLPVLLLGYNRPDLFKKQLDFLLLTIKCQKIYISVDGAKSNLEDQKKVTAIHQIVKKAQSQFPGKIKTQLSSQNQGCRIGVESGIDWFFEQVEAGVILEDDCEPHPDFFEYCQQLLKKYQNDERIGMIAGTNPLVRSNVAESYFFSNQSIIWGWATWRRAWKSYHKVQKVAPQLLHNSEIEQAILNVTSPKHLLTIKKVVNGEIDTWDYIWYLTNILQSRLCIIPTHNLVSNQGFTADATHTKIKTTQAALQTYSLNFPLKHPEVVITNPTFEQNYLHMINRPQVLMSVFKAYALSWASLLKSKANNYSK